jgi:sec-independent protein translocase protein TatB
MFDIGWSELLVIAIVAIVVVGPKGLPGLMRTFGHYAGKLRHAASDFQRQFEAAMAESEVDAVRKNIENIRSGLDEPVMLPKPASASPPAAMGSPSMAPVPEPVKSPPKSTPAKSKAKPKTAAKRRKAKS